MHEKTIRAIYGFIVVVILIAVYLKADAALKVVVKRMPEESFEDLGDVIVDVRNESTGAVMHHRIVRGFPREYAESDKDPKQWGARVVRETLGFKLGTEGK